MEPGQQFCLRWNNYQSTLQHVFHKQWVAGNFVDVSLIVEGRRLDCHKMVLSACSSYFETLLQEHSTHNHPFIILHDLSYHAVESIINFMYQGQVNVSQEQLADLLKVAEALKVKGLADSNAINSFSKSRLLQNLPQLERTPQFPSAVNGNVNYPNTTATSGYQQRVPTPKPTVNKYKTNVSVGGRQPFKNLIEVAGASSVVKGHQKKRPRQDETNDNLPTTLPNSLPPTPPSSFNDTSLNESQPSPMAQSIPEVFTPKQEAEYETDGELQIDESAAASPAEPDSRPGSRGPENEARDQDEENKPHHPGVLGPTSESNLLNPLHTYTVSTYASQEQGLLGGMKNIFGDMKNIKIEKPNYSLAGKNANMISMPKNMVKTYTNKDLEEGIESVLSGKLTPAKAISKFRIPRRTFFRRLSAVRKERGIPSAKENTADYYLSSSDSPANVNLGALADAQNRLALPTTNNSPVQCPDKFQALKIKSDKQLLVEPKKKKAKKSDEAMNPNESYFSLLNFATSNNYDTYLNYLKFVAQQPDARSAAEGAIDALKKAQKGNSADLDSNSNGIMVDGNSNLASVDNANKTGASDSRSASPSSERSMSPVDNGKDFPADSENGSQEDENASSDDENRIATAIVTPDVTEAALALLSQKRDATLALVTQNGGSKSPLLKGRGRSADSSVSVS